MSERWAQDPDGGWHLIQDRSSPGRSSNPRLAATAIILSFLFLPAAIGAGVFGAWVNGKRFMCDPSWTCDGSWATIGYVGAAVLGVACLVCVVLGAVYSPRKGES